MLLLLRHLEPLSAAEATRYQSDSHILTLSSRYSRDDAAAPLRASLERRQSSLHPLQSIEHGLGSGSNLGGGGHLSFEVGDAGGSLGHVLGLPGGVHQLCEAADP